MAHLRLRIAWPHGKFALLAYTESGVWAPYIEQTLLPQVGGSCVVINRSKEDWKRRFPAERRALAFWGGLSSFNPIAIVLSPWGTVRVFRLYDGFTEFKHGDRALLEKQMAEFVACIRERTNARP